MLRACRPSCRGGRWRSAVRSRSGPGSSTWGWLRGPRFERLFPDVYCPRGDEPPDLRLRSLAAYRLVEGRGVLAGYSAAVLLDADCARYRDVPAEVTVAGGGQRVHDGLVVRRERIAPGETIRVDGVRCTSPLRTAYDLGRRRTWSRRWWPSTVSPTGTGSPRISCCTSARTIAAGRGRPAVPARLLTPIRTPGRRWRPACV